MASKAWDKAVNGTGGNSAFQYSAPIPLSLSQWETPLANAQRNQGQRDAVGLQNWYLRNQQTAFDNQQGQLKNLLSGSGGGSGDVGAPSADNRFEAGLSDAEGRLRSLLDNPDSVQQSAAYKFRVGQGQEALQRSLGAKGMLNSGNRLMELTKYGQDMGSQEYDNQFGRIKDLVGGYSGSWIGDKNANTGIYNAQTNRLANNQRNALGWAGLSWDMNKPQAVGGSRSSGGGSTAGLYDVKPENYDSDFFNIQKDSNSVWNPETGQRETNYWDKKTGKTWTGSADPYSNYGRNPAGNWS